MSPLFGVVGGNVSPLILGDVLGVVWDLLGLRSHHRRVLDPLLLDVLREDEESTLNLRSKPAFRGGEREGLGAVVGRDCLPLPGTVDS